MRDECEMLKCQKAPIRNKVNSFLLTILSLSRSLHSIHSFSCRPRVVIFLCLTHIYIEWMNENLKVWCVWEWEKEKRRILQLFADIHKKFKNITLLAVIESQFCWVFIEAISRAERGRLRNSCCKFKIAIGNHIQVNQFSHCTGSGKKEKEQELSSWGNSIKNQNLKLLSCFTGFCQIIKV